MGNLSLKNIMSGKISEDISEPSEQIMKGAMILFKQSTGLNPAFPTFKGKNKRTNSALYESSLSKEIRTSLMKILFTDINLRITVRELENVIGGYSFDFTLGINLTDGTTNIIPMGTINFKDNKYYAKFN
ncbi:hypothetical protein EBR43_12465 [bacterium]|nr:hypothetical protein [bacterium]